MVLVAPPTETVYVDQHFFAEVELATSVCESGAHAAVGAYFILRREVT